MIFCHLTKMQEFENDLENQFDNRKKKKKKKKKTVQVRKFEFQWIVYNLIIKSRWFICVVITAFAAIHSSGE